MGVFRGGMLVSRAEFTKLLKIHTQRRIGSKSIESGLLQMVVRIDKAGTDDLVAGVNDLYIERNITRY